MAFDFPASPSTGTLYQPSGGPTYRYDGAVWSVIGAQFQGAMPSDAPPSNPVPGQLWWESDTGALFIYYDDGNSQQWVQISGTVGLPPNDGNEYVMRNGVWRLKSQSFDLTGLSTLDFACPAWNPSSARIRLYGQNATGCYHAMRVSQDGTTFFAGASDYSQGGFTHSSGTNAFANQAPGAQNSLILTGTADHTIIVQSIDLTIKLGRPGGTDLLNWSGRGDYYNLAASVGMTQSFYYGYPQSNTVIDRIRALRWFTSASVVIATGRLVVEWLP